MPSEMKTNGSRIRCPRIMLQDEKHKTFVFCVNNMFHEILEHIQPTDKCAWTTQLIMLLRQPSSVKDLARFIKRNILFERLTIYDTPTIMIESARSYFIKQLSKHLMSSILIILFIHRFECISSKQLTIKYVQCSR